LARNILKETCIVYLISVAQASAKLSEDPFGEFPLLDCVSTYWPYHLNEAEHHDQVLARYLAVAFSQRSFDLTLPQGGLGDERGYILANELRFICSRGSPCEQCTRISLGSQQALIPRFNDLNVSQLELLGTFVIPGTEFYPSLL
jgi:hypothetical protein